MPKELVAISPGRAQLREYADPPLKSEEIRIKTDFASPKHGTELMWFHGAPVTKHRYNRELGVITNDTGMEQFPFVLGNMAVGTVTDTGANVTRFSIGSRVFGHFPIRETQTVHESRADLLPDDLTPEAAVCLDPAVAAMAIRDAPVRIGDQVAVFGLGALGLMVVQMVSLSGADQIIAVGRHKIRQAAAIRLGADFVMDPSENNNDPAMAVRQICSNHSWKRANQPEPSRVVGGYWERSTTNPQAGEPGVDVAIEVSGNPVALHQAIRSTRFGGTVCILSAYGADSAGLWLGDEFHFNRLTLISARAGSLPLRDAPGWSLTRLAHVVLGWLRSGRLSAKDIIQPIVAFEDSVEAISLITSRPDKCIKLGITF